MPGIITKTALKFCKPVILENFEMKIDALLASRKDSHAK